MNKLPEDLTHFIYQSYTASSRLASLQVEQQNQLLLKIAEALKQELIHILEANTYDLEASREMAIPDLLLEWMKLTPDRLHRTIDYLKHLAHLPNPLAQNTVTYNHYFKTVPLGSVAFIYEALPHLVVIMAGMCIKSGNSLILRGGSEISHSQEAITDVIQRVIKNSDLQLSDFTVAIAPQGTGIKDLVTQEKYLRLVIPYGRPSFVQQIAKQSTLSILPAAMGNCYMYLSPTGNLDQALEIIKASRQGDPDPVNAIEKVLIHSGCLSPENQNLANWAEQLRSSGLKIKGGDRFVNYCRNYPEIFAEADINPESQWGQSYLDDTLALRIVDNVDEAIEWINQYSSGHADAIMSDSLTESQRFVGQIKSSNIFINTHSKFNRLDGDRVALGMTSLKNRGLSRYGGIIDLQSLTTTKRIITTT
jgi:glutamate-5-semialdehyde dehydrogenase